MSEYLISPHVRLQNRTILHCPISLYSSTTQFFLFFPVHKSIDSRNRLDLSILVEWRDKAIVASAYPLEESFIFWNAVQNVSISTYCFTLCTYKSIRFYCIHFFILLPFRLHKRLFEVNVDAGRYHGASEVGELSREEYFIQIVGIPDNILPFDEVWFPFTPSTLKLRWRTPKYGPFSY